MSKTDLSKLPAMPLDERVNALLSLADLTQAEAARRSGLHSQTVHWWTAGKTKTMGLTSAMKFFRVLAERIDGLELEHVIGEVP